MQLALSAPERVERLVLACTAARFGDPEQWRDRAALVRAEGSRRSSTPCSPGGSRRGSSTPLRIATCCSPSIREGYARCCDALAAWDVRGALAAVRAPTLVIAGADDPSTPPETVEQISAAIPGARFEVIEQAAHIPSVEQADVFNRLIEEHL